MKKNTKKILAIMICVLLIVAIAAPAAFAEGITPVEVPENPIQETGRLLLTETLVAVTQIVGTVLKTAITVFGIWLAGILAKTIKTETLRKASDHVIDMALQTVDELQQTTVDTMKAMNGGKLTKGEIAQLRTELVNITLKKLSGPAVDLLRAGAVDLNGLILGAGDAYIKSKKENKEINAAIVEGFTTE